MSDFVELGANDTDTAKLGGFGDLDMAPANDHFKSWSPNGDKDAGSPAPMLGELNVEPTDWRSALTHGITTDHQIAHRKLEVDWNVPPVQNRTRKWGQNKHWHPNPKPGEIDFDKHDWKAEDDMRAHAWSIFAGDARTVDATWNALVPQVALFQHAEKDVSLDSEFFTNDKTTGDLPSMANTQHAPRTGKTTVGDLFKDNKFEVSKAETAGLQKAGKDHNVDSFSSKRRQLDQELSGKLEAVKEASSLLQAAEHGLEGAVAQIKLTEAKEDKVQAEAELEKIKGDKAMLGSIFTGVFSFAANAFGLGAAVGGFGGNGKHGTDNAQSASGLAGMASELILSAAFSGKIAAAEARIEEAQKRVTQSTHLKDTAAYNEALQRKKAALSRVKVAQAELRAKVLERKRVYSQLGTQVGEKSGTTGTTRERLQGMIAAIPTLELVIARAEIIAGAAAPPPYTRLSGQGLAMAVQAKRPITQSFWNTVGELNGIKLAFGSVGLVWKDKLKHLQGVIKTLESAAG